MFGREAFAKMKKTAIILNTARGAVIDTAALADALQSGRIGGAGFDVMPQEPPAKDDPLLGCPNLVITPHVGWYSEGSIVNLQANIARYVAEVCVGKKPGAVVNPDVLKNVKLS
jgi:D-3-phosphoglycerate dehydrogenase